MEKLNNLAVDYSLYDQEDDNMTERKIKHNVSPKKSRIRKAKKLLSAKTMVMLGVVMALLCGMIFGKVEISSLCAEQTKLDNQLEQLQRENVELQSEVAQKTGMTKVEDYAENKLGLQKLDKAQIEYVQVDRKPTASVIEAKEENIFVKIKNWFNSVVEYIGG